MKILTQNEKFLISAYCNIFLNCETFDDIVYNFSILNKLVNNNENISIGKNAEIFNGTIKEEGN